MTDYNKKTQNKMSKQEVKDFYELCDYIKYKILEYTEDMKFPQFLALRIKGIQQGKYLANNNSKKQANYSYPDILLAFKIYRFAILSELRDRQKFKDEKHRINYMMKIIESKLNDVIEMRKARDKSNEKAENIKIDAIELGAYKKKTKENKNKRLNDLW